METTKKTELLRDIRSRRNSLDITQEEIADDLGMSRATYISSETGARPFKVKELQTLATIFQLPVNAFLEYESVRKQNEVDIAKYKQVLMRCLIKGASPTDSKIPKTKLAKLIYLVDYTFFYNHSESVTGAQYKRMNYGPVPDVFFTTIDELFEQEAIVLEINMHSQLISPNERFPDDLLNQAEKELIDKICAKWQARSTGEIVEFTHEQLPWKTCKNREVIPYELIIQEEPSKLY